MNSELAAVATNICTGEKNVHPCTMAAGSKVQWFGGALFLQLLTHQRLRLQGCWQRSLQRCLQQQQCLRKNAPCCLSLSHVENSHQVGVAELPCTLAEARATLLRFLQLLLDTLPLCSREEEKTVTGRGIGGSRQRNRSRKRKSRGEAGERGAMGGKNKGHPKICQIGGAQKLPPAHVKIH